MVLTHSGEFLYLKMTVPKKPHVLSFGYPGLKDSTLVSPWKGVVCCHKTHGVLEYWNKYRQIGVSMVVHLIRISIWFLVFTSFQGFADTLYTWTDADGVIHISEKKPPANALQTSLLAYIPSRPPDTKDAAASSAEQHTESVWLSALEQARHERKNAENARKSAEDAILTATLMKKEADEFLALWKNKSRIKRGVQRQIEQRIQQTNQTIERAEALIRLANEAEQAARQAEMEARRVEQELFDQYKKIMSN
jgi:hypothetical protein